MRASWTLKLRLQFLRNPLRVLHRKKLNWLLAVFIVFPDLRVCFHFRWLMPAEKSTKQNWILLRMSKPKRKKIRMRLIKKLKFT